jgi:serine/threonine protein kinase/tetratricopeptide (TPR) repeat protein
VDPLRWQRIGELFAAASLLDDARRIPFLKESCGQDQDLFEQVKALLDIDDQQGLLDSMPIISAIGIPKIVAGRFRIIRYIAEGGMGTVYEAEDLQLQDRVALKTIRPDIASNSQAVERFKQEIRLAKRVTHPNVCRIHDLGTDRSENGTEFLFLTMQFLGGETLSSRIRKGPIPPDEALPLIEDMADALSAAHQAEVIHRDFKSGNVILVPSAQRTCAVVTDFGLARGVNDGASRSGLVGTVDYMAPEQIIGGEITPATDIYAFGVVIYEMVTGQLPFTGDSKGSVVKKHLNDEPQPPRALAPHLDANWNEAILGCLRKLPGERFQSAAEVKAAVLRSATPPWRVGKQHAMLITLFVVFLIAMVALLRSSQAWMDLVPAKQHTPSEAHIQLPITSIAVLPLESFSGNREQAYFADGMTEELINSLSRIGALRVISRTSVMNYKGGHKALRDIARELNVDAVVEGTVQQSRGHVKISANLVDAREDRNLWGHSYEGEMRNVLGLQSDVAQAIASEIQVRLSPDESAGFTARRTVDPLAYDLYLRGLYFLNKRTPEDLRKALDEFGKAVERDPNFAESWAAVADSYTLLADLGMVAPRQAMPLAEAAAKRALELDNSLAQAHASLGIIRWMYDWDSASAGDEFARAVALNPNYATGHEWRGISLSLTGKFSEAIKEMQRAQELDPLSLPIRVNTARCYYYARRYDEATKLLTQLEQEEPSFWMVPAALGATYLVNGRLDDAIQALERARKISPSALRNLGALGDAYGRIGQQRQALAIVAELDTLSHTRYVPAIYGALVNIGIGDKTRIFTLLNKAFHERSEWMMELDIEPEFDPLRDDARFDALLRRVSAAKKAPKWGR